MSNKSQQDDVNKIVQRPRIQRAVPINRVPRSGVPAVVGAGGVDRGVGSDVGDSGPGLRAPLTMTVQQTKTVSVPVPPGANFVDVEVVEKYTLIDAVGEKFPVTVINYP